jgi:serine/threonine protein kinase
VFACAVILFSMMYGMPPYLYRASSKDPYYKFFSQGRQEVYWRALRNKLNLDIKDSFADLMNKMLCSDPHSRISIAQLLKHPWLREGEESAE